MFLSRSLTCCTSSSWLLKKSRNDEMTLVRHSYLVSICSTGQETCMQVNWSSMHGTWWPDRRISSLDTEGGAWDKPRIEYVGMEVFEFSCPFKSVNRKQEGKYSQYLLSTDTTRVPFGTITSATQLGPGADSCKLSSEQLDRPQSVDPSGREGARSEFISVRKFICTPYSTLV
jgi:hypothetical protein